jgi:DNA end-binding protein Ku
MQRALWSGSISFGLVNIPIRMYSATQDRSVRFHLLHDQDHARLQRKLVCSADGREVHPEHVVRGYEVEPERFVVIREDELEALAPRESRTIDIHDFVPMDQIDPVYFEKPYYLAPGENATKPYRLLVEAMERSKKVAIATFVMREREYLATLRPVEGVICLETMHFSDEVLDADEIVGEVQGRVDDRELKMARSLIASLTTRFKPGKYHDEHQRRLHQMVEQKAKGRDIISPPQVEEKPQRVINLMAALEASLAEAKKKSRKAPAAGGRSGRSGRGGESRRRRSA